jgi:hypothetical protein
VTGGDFAAAVTPHRFLPNDPANKYLTDGDRVAVRNATGVDVRADGGIACPVSMDVETYSKVLQGVGQIAADRASGRLTGPITQGYLSTVLHPAAAAPGFAGLRGVHGLDVRA